MATVMRSEPLDSSRADFLRGDPITGDRYFSADFAQREWDHMWTRVWHVAGRAAQVPNAGDWLTHHFGRESVIVVRQPGGAIRALGLADDRHSDRRPG